MFLLSGDYSNRFYKASLAHKSWISISSFAHSIDFKENYVLAKEISEDTRNF